MNFLYVKEKKPIHYMDNQLSCLGSVKLTMPKQHKGDTLITDAELKHVSDLILVTWVNKTRHW
jgi:hypothetical protein